MYMPLPLQKQDSIYELHAHWKTTKRILIPKSLFKIFCKIQKLDNSFTLPKSVVKAKGIRTLLDFQRKDGWMKATTVPLHKILGSHTLSQNSYAPGQVLQKIWKLPHWVRYVYTERIVRQGAPSKRQKLNKLNILLETTEYFAHTQHKFNKPKRHCMKWTQIPLEYFSNWQRQKTFHLAS